MPSPACNVAHYGHTQFLYNLGGRVVLLAITVTQNTIAPTAPRVSCTLSAESKPVVENTSVLVGDSRVYKALSLAAIAPTTALTLNCEVAPDLSQADKVPDSSRSRE